MASATKPVTIADLGLGNLHSVAQAFTRAGVAAHITRDPDELRRAERLVFPGQGAFRECAEMLATDVGPALRDFIASGRPYLGICLGMQALFETSEESEGQGLGVFPGRVVRFAPEMHDTATGDRLKVPHMGWNQVDTAHPMLEDAGWYYFVHSYYVVPSDPSLVAATSDYGVRFCAAVARDNVFACQFHPEKSHHAGARLIQRFLAQ
ncbi:MAG: imidazole glycerol phosphate synthase subunit HisH [Sandaracinaceae bacterium]|mgnify:FL=1|jgi:glutamine amidotransferase|nr:imidazole glycerol phosphate synthase subunit HisH [Sandaracinaceae bacterium]MBK6807879.1 imidazole glycerol phosphate synthase subunit HisH [Sandaracinaceae bacterium]MBK7772907.1 imidazole glycerol phosphate synthase subunit HisH [Sandaracinaceae bacterium]MBK8407117.1 imidazole glycerol phosphate synthase subunit HisH [Sandaracinaceae bacterium]MBK8588805.1 imidazole glycerol phosphate synthase subunit HisH [Sandaracinaceae bacterium]